jgi:Cof subfamily protein (haloacid dehalogenase superfamily)
MSKIALVISDVDGTLVTSDKRLTERSVQAVKRLHRHGIGFSIVSSRPPMGMRMLVEPLALALPIGAFSGGTIVSPHLHVIEQHVISEWAARRAIEIMQEFGADIWLYTSETWYARKADGDYVPREKRTIEADPIVIPDFGPHLAGACKIVGSSKNFARLAECETATREGLREQASVARSQSYYLDVTPPGVNKGTFLTTLSRRLGIQSRSIAVMGDMGNDLAMFAEAGLSIAMGNAGEEVKRSPRTTTMASLRRLKGTFWDLTARAKLHNLSKAKQKAEKSTCRT